MKRKKCDFITLTLQKALFLCVKRNSHEKNCNFVEFNIYLHRQNETEMSCATKREKKFNNEIREEFNLTLILTGKTQDEEDSAQNFPLFFVFLKRKPYICTVHFDKSKTETDNNKTRR